MKKSVQEYYEQHFPPIPEKLLDDAIEKYKSNPCLAYSNYALLHCSCDRLYIHCIHIFRKGYGYDTSTTYHNGHFILEQNRYIFSKSEGYHRFTEKFGEWKSTRFAEPAFSKGYYYAPQWAGARQYGLVYDWIDIGRLPFFRYLKCSDVSSFPYYKFMRFLKLLVKHPNAEYLFKSGFSSLVYDEAEYNNNTVNWNSNNLKTMLGLNKNELKTIIEKKAQNSLWEYKCIKSLYPKLSLELSADASKIFSSPYELQNMLERLNKYRHVTPTKLIVFLSSGNIKPGDYEDYIDQCRKLEYDLRDSMYMFPKNFYAMHERCTQTLDLIEEEKKQQKTTALNTKVRERLEELQCLLFEYEDLMIVLPESASSIYYEGKILNHCVGGYAERHANGVLSIVFLRTKNKPDIPYYTMEISTDNKIVQCRGFKNNQANNPKPQSVVDFEKAYQIYLNKFNKESKTA